MKHLRKAHEGAENLPEGITGVGSFHELAEAYEAKATLYKMLLETLEDDKERIGDIGWLEARIWIETCPLKCFLKASKRPFKPCSVALLASLAP